MQICGGTESQMLKINDVELSVNTWQGSTVYMKTILPLAVTNVLYNRVEFDPTFFTEHTLNENKYVTLSKVLSKKRNEQLFKLNNWVKSALPILSKKYLKELYLIIKNKETSDVIEHYRFTLKYQDDERKINFPPHEEVYEITSQFIRNINMLGEQSKITEANEIAIQIVLNKDAPKDYKVSNFSYSNPLVDPNDSNNYVHISTLDTGFHRFRILGKGDIFNIDTDIPELADEELIENKIILGKDTKHIKDNEIQCYCGIFSAFDIIDLILCSICEKYQHLPCIGFRQSEYAVQLHVCVPCCIDKKIKCNDPRMEKTKYKDQQELLAQTRLIIQYCLQINNPMEIINKLPKQKRPMCLSKFQTAKLIVTKRKKLYVDVEMIESRLLHRYFYEPRKGVDVQLSEFEQEYSENTMELVPAKKQKK